MTYNLKSPLCGTIENDTICRRLPAIRWGAHLSSPCPGHLAVAPRHVRCKVRNNEAIAAAVRADWLTTLAVEAQVNGGTLSMDQIEEALGG